MNNNTNKYYNMRKKNCVGMRSSDSHELLFENFLLCMACDIVAGSCRMISALYQLYMQPTS